MGAALRIVVLRAALVAAGASPIVAADRAVAWALPRGGLARGVVVDGRSCEDADVAACVERVGARVRDRTVTLFADDASMDVSLGELGASLDAGETLARARGVGRVGSMAARVGALRRAATIGVDVAAVLALDEARAERVLGELAARSRRAPVDARLDLEHRARVGDEPGAELDVGAALATLRAARLDDGDAIALPMRRLPAALRESMLAAIDPSRVLAAYETKFSTVGVGAARAVNIANAARRLDGAVVAPGETLSFNATVGERTLARGFGHAPEIVGDELQDGVGGGTCQVASTLHAAAVFAALTIVERHEHGRPSAYTKLGLDATVSWPATDLRIMNARDVPLVVHAHLPTPNSVRVEILGADAIARVAYAEHVLSSEDFVRRITPRGFLRPGAWWRHQVGIRGMVVASSTSIAWSDGREETRGWISHYRPTPEVIWVGPDVERDALPALPKGARGVEGDGVAAGDAPVAGGGA